MDIKAMMQQASQMQGKMAELKEKISQIIVTGTAGGELVECKINGNGKLLAINLSDELLKEDKIIIEDLIVASFNNAKSNQEEEVKKITNEFTSSFGLPSGMLPSGF